MTQPVAPTLYQSPRQLFSDILQMVVGCLISAVAINGILVPQHFVAGGVTGIALILNDMAPHLGLAGMYLALNIPLFFLAWMAVGRRFFVYSVFGMASLSLAIALVQIEIRVEEPILSALLAGLLIGAGTGLSLRTYGSQGGLDILAVMLMKRFSISIGSTILVVNGLVLLLVSLYYSLEAVLYTMIVLYVSAKMVTLVVTGLSQRKAVIIISSQWQKIAEEILKDIRHGVTIIKGEGGFSGKQEHILYSVIPFSQIGQLKRLVAAIDRDAFVVISDTMEVVNYRIGNQPHW